MNSYPNNFFAMNDRGMGTVPHLSRHAERTLRPRFTPLCNGDKLQELINELAANVATSGDASQTLSSQCLGSDSISPADRPRALRQSTKKQVKFFGFCTMGLFRPPTNASDLYWRNEDKEKSKLDAVSMACQIRSTLHKQSSLNLVQQIGKRIDLENGSNTPTSNTLGISIFSPILVAIEKGNYIQADELIGLEDLVQGSDHIRNKDIQRKKINRIVVSAWRHLKQNKQRQQGTHATETSEADEAIGIEVSELYKKISRKSLVKARCHAAYVNGMNNGVDSSLEPALASTSRRHLGGKKRRRGPCGHSAHEA